MSGPTGAARKAGLVGRTGERAALDHAFAEAAGGRPTSAYLRGVSGAGKTTLGQRFLADLADRGDGVVLAGRCYEHESVPFKAFDSLIDALTDHLLTQPPEEVAPLLGAHTGELARLFPVLERIPLVKEAARVYAARLATSVNAAGIEHESRRRAFAALKRLLYALALRRPGGPGDRRPALDRRRQRAPARRAARPAGHAAAAGPGGLPQRLAGLAGGAAGARADPAARGPRPERDPGRCSGRSRRPTREALARGLLQAANLRATQPWAASLAAESGGNAFLISASRSSHLSREPGTLTAARREGGSLDGMLAARLTRLDPGAQALLELIAVAGQPVPAELLAAAQGRPPGLNAWLGELHAERLIFLGQRGRERSVECAHDRLREVVVRSAADRVPGLHRRLADTAVALGRDDPEFLARHLHAAGDLDAAALHAVRAALAAAGALAFDRAAELYRLALRCTPGSWTLIESCADANVNAGRCSEAAPLYFKAAGLAPASERFGLWQKSCEQFFVGGETEHAIEVLRALLFDLGLDYPDTSEVIHRQFLAMMGALARREEGPPLGPAPVVSAVAVDTLWAASKGFLVHSPVRGAYFAAASAQLAERLNDEGRVARGLTALAGVTTREQEPHILDALRARVDAYIAATEDPYVIGFTSIMDGIVASIGNKWSRALHDLEFGSEHLRRHCTGVFWESSMSMLMVMSLLETRGELRSISDRNALLSQQAKETGNAMTEFVAAYYSALMLIAADAIAPARDLVRKATEIGLSQELPAVHLRTLMIEVSCDLYEGDVVGAWSRVERAWIYNEQSRVLYARSQRTNASGLRGQVALALARTVKGEEKIRLLTIADGERRALESIGTPQARALAALFKVLSTVATRPTATSVVARMQTAIAAFEAADMSLHAACLSYRLGEWTGGDKGAAMIARSEAFMRLQTIVRPQQWVAMVTPNLHPV
jgi:hypothetical protein